jgi:hypothetical protein
MSDDDTKRVRDWCFTYNNYTAEEEEMLKTDKDILYMIYGHEIAPTTGTPHLQGYFYFKNAKTRSAIKKRYKRISVRPCNGSAEQNRAYCIKDGKDIVEIGVMPKQGKRTDLDGVKNQIMEGKKVDDICLENPMIYHQYGRTLHKIEDIRMRKVFRNEMTEGYWIWGPTGCGKSEYVFKDFNPDEVYVWKYDNGWNDGYAQQSVVVIDEFRGQMPMNELLMMIDKHPNYYVRRRGREPVPFTSKKVYITSSMPPDEVYHNLSENDKLDQLFRRIKIIKLEKNIF